MSINEIREAVKTQTTDPVPDAIMKVFRLEMRDYETIGTDAEGMPITKPVSQMREVGHYKTKLDAIMHMIEISPLAFKDGQLKKPIATTTVCSDIYEVYEIDLNNPNYPNIKTIYILKEIVLD